MKTTDAIQALQSNQAVITKRISPLHSGHRVEALIIDATFSNGDVIEFDDRDGEASCFSHINRQGSDQVVTYVQDLAHAMLATYENRS